MLRPEWTAKSFRLPTAEYKDLVHLVLCSWERPSGRNVLHHILNYCYMCCSWTILLFIITYCWSCIREEWTKIYYLNEHANSATGCVMNLGHFDLWENWWVLPRLTRFQIHWNESMAYSWRRTGQLTHYCMWFQAHSTWLCAHYTSESMLWDTIKTLKHTYCTYYMLLLHRTGQGNHS